MNKETIISKLNTSRREILDLLEGIPQQAMVAPGVIDQWSIKDLLVHLTRWEAELVKLLWQLKQGNQPTTIHFGSEDTNAINARWYQESKSRSLDIVWIDFITVREQTLRRILDFSESELTKRKYYSWLMGKPLWEWIAADSYEHEAEHFKNIQAWKEGIGKSS